MNTDNLQFIFTPDGFYVDTASINTENEKQQLAIWQKNGGYPALYQMGLEVGSQKMTLSGNFLYHVSEQFFRALTELPELEIARENVQVAVSDKIRDELLQEIPFGIGTEFIDEKWLQKVFARLQEIFAEEIKVYDGTVEMYFTEKNQKLHVPERVFFHLVENKDPDFPFAFLATYATKGEDGKVKHVPLKYALTEYGNDRQKLLVVDGLFLVPDC